MEPNTTKHYFAELKETYERWERSDEFKEERPGYLSGIREGYMNALLYAMTTLVKVQENELQTLLTKQLREKCLVQSKGE